RLEREISRVPKTSEIRQPGKEVKGKPVNRIMPRQIRQGASVYNKSRLSEWQICYVMALIDGLRLINEKATEKGMSDEPITKTDKLGRKWNTGKSEID